MLKLSFYRASLSLALLLSASVVYAADAPPMRMYLKDGSYVDGHLAASAPDGFVGFKCDLFRQPLAFDVRGIRSVAGDVTSNDQLSGHFFLIEGGSRISGELKQWNDENIVIDSPSLGTLRLKRSLLRSIEAAEDGGKRVYTGPRSLDDWKLLGNSNHWNFAAGSLTATSKEARAVGKVGLPEKFRLSLSMSWEGRADFVLSLGCNEPKVPAQPAAVPGRRVVVAKPANDGAAVRLEMWDAQLAVVREIGNLADIAVLPLDDDVSRFEMTFYVDQVAGLVAVYSPRGRQLEKILVADDKGKSRAFALLENHGKQVSLDRFDVYSWDGHLPSSTEYPESYVLDSKENILRGVVDSFDAEQGMLTLAGNDGEKTELPLADLRRVVISQPAEPQPEKSGEEATEEPDQQTEEPDAGDDLAAETDPARLIEIEFVDSSRLIGHLSASANGSFQFTAMGVDGQLKCAAENVIAMIGSETRFAGDKLPGTVGSIVNDSTNLKGCLTDNPSPEGDAVLLWQPWASNVSCALAPNASGMITYSKARSAAQAVGMNAPRPVQVRQEPALGGLLGGLFGGGNAGVARPQAVKAIKGDRYEIVFRTGDTVDGVVESIDERGVKFESAETTTEFVPHDKMDSVTLSRMLSRVTFDEQKMKRLMTVPRAQKADPPTHLFLSTTGDYLRGRLLSVDAENVTVEVRLDVKAVPRSKISRIIWLHERPWLDDKKEDKKAEGGNVEPENDDQPFLVHAVRPDKRGVTFAPKKVIDGRLSGESDLLGECSVSLSGIQSLLFGRDVGKQALQLRKQSWVLSLATLPKVYQDSPDGPATMGVQSSLVGRDAPAIVLDTIEGEPFDLKNLRGKVVVLDFWASWCGPCIQTMPEVDRIVEEFSDDDVELVAVNLQDSVERAKLAIKRMELKATVIMDVDGEAGRYYDARAIPQTVIVDREGKITHLFVGGGAKFLDEFATALKSVVVGENAADADESADKAPAETGAE